MTTTTAGRTEVPPPPASAADTGTSDAAEDAVAEERSKFEMIRDYITDQIGAVRRVEAGQQSAEALLGEAENELSDLKRLFEAARLGPR